MSEQLLCPNCGAPQIPDAAFCVKCGQRIAGIPAPQAAGSAAQQVVPAPAQAQAPTSAPVAPVAPPAWSQPGPPSAQAPGPVPPNPQPPVTPAGQQSWYRLPAPYPPGTGQSADSAPPADYEAEPARPRPTGISILAILEIVAGGLGLLAAKTLLDYADTVTYYHGAGSAGNYQLVGLLSAVGAIAALVLAYGLWHIKAWAWPLGVGLCAVTIGFALLSVVNHGDAGAALVNVGVSAGALYYLNTNDIRDLFGRPPSNFLQPRP